jgi:hypothetical protein
MKDLIELYKSFGQSVGIVSDPQGFMNTLLPGSDTPKPWTIDSKRAVLPLPDQLKQTDWSNRIGFHPLLQNVASGDSRVMEKFRDRMNGYADFMLGMLLVDIAQLGAKKNMHQDLIPAQAAYLGPFSDVDEKFVKLLTDLVATKRPTKKNAEFVRFSVIKGRAWQGQKRSRVAVMHFPLYEQLPKDNKPVVILGHKLRINDVKMLRTMYEFLFQGIREAGFYEVGSDSKIAPSMESLMAVYAMFADPINTAVAILEPVLNTSNALYIVTDWREDLAKIEEYLPQIRKIPMLEGNAPSERIATPNAPVHITEKLATEPVRTVAAANTAPTLTAQAAAQVQVQQHIQQVQQGAQQVQDQSNTGVRFKLGSRGPTVAHDQVTHQLPETFQQPVQSQPLRPAVQLAPTPAVGTILQAQQVAAGVHPQQQFAGQVLPGVAAQPVAQATKVPESARLFNGALYIPVESSGVSGIPAGAVMIDNKVYVPLAAAGAPVGVPGQVGFNPNNRFAAQNQAVTDPSQVPGLSEQEILYYRANPVMFQNYLQQMQSNNAMAAATQIAQRQQQVPRYLQTAIQQAQVQQQQATGFFARR